MDTLQMVHTLVRRELSYYGHATNGPYTCQARIMLVWTRYKWSIHLSGNN